MVEPLEQRLKQQARAAGFAAARIAAAGAAPEAAARLAEALRLGWHGDMDWLARTADRRGSPAALWPEVRSVLMLAKAYGPGPTPERLLPPADRGAVAAYAKGRDYHDVVKADARLLAAWLAAESGAEVKVFVDTAPVMEKPIAAAAGLGWQGKHTNLVSRELGSWFFLAAIYTTAVLAPDPAEDDHCGSCRRCLDICPTDAFPAPYRLDARRCISYLTIEHKGAVAPELRPLIGNRIFGCDDCLAVCPWNKFAAKAADQRLAARAVADNPPLEELLRLDDAAFRARFAGTPIKRTGRDRFVRNVLIASGNSGNASLAPAVAALIGDSSPLVRAMAAWAMGRLLPPDDVEPYRTRALAIETDPEVRAEWQSTRPLTPPRGY